MKTMCPPGYHHNGFMATHALGHMMYIYVIIYYPSYLQGLASRFSQWFSENQMKGNTYKCHLLMNKDKSLEIRNGEFIIKSIDCEKVLGIKVDSKLQF